MGYDKGERLKMSRKYYKIGVTLVTNFQLEAAPNSGKIVGTAPLFSPTAPSVFMCDVLGSCCSTVQ
jgi:hypothetical protein